jgi:hypothetical protein
MTGFISWKFNQKTGITGQDFKTFILSNPGFDAYFINPFPHQACFKNVWKQGDYFHPRLSQITDNLLKNAGYQLELFSFENRMDTLCYCNYWVGSPLFWSRYIAFILPLYNYINERATKEELEAINVKADRVIAAPYTPFIFERMFSTFLATNPDLKAYSFSYTPKLLEKKYRKISKRLIAMQKALQERNSLFYTVQRLALYFRLYGIRKIPLIALYFSKIGSRK